MNLRDLINIHQINRRQAGLWRECFSARAAVVFPYLCKFLSVLSISVSLFELFSCRFSNRLLKSISGMFWVDFLSVLVLLPLIFAHANEMLRDAGEEPETPATASDSINSLHTKTQWDTVHYWTLHYYILLLCCALQNCLLLLYTFRPLPKILYKHWSRSTYSFLVVFCLNVCIVLKNRNRRFFWTGEIYMFRSGLYCILYIRYYTIPY